MATAAIQTMIIRIKTLLLNMGLNLRLRPFDTSTSDGRARERNRRVFLTTLSSILLKFIAIAVVLITTPITLRYLGAASFGLWMTIYSLIAVLGFADLGIGNGLLNTISEAHGRDDKKLARRAVTSSVLFLAIFSAVAVLTFICGYGYIDWGVVFNLSDPDVARAAGEATTVLVICLAFSLPLLTVQKVQLGYQEGLQANLWQIVGHIFVLVGVVLTIYFQAGLPYLVLAAAGGPAIAMALNWLYYFVVARPYLLPRLSSFDWRMSQHVFAMGALWTWFQVMAFLGTSADSLIITHLFENEAVGGYAVMSRIQSGLLVAQLLSAPLWPAFSEAIERGDIEWARRTFRRALWLFAWMGAFSAFVLGVGSFWIVRIWVGPEMVPTWQLALGFALWGFVSNLFAAIAALMANNRLIKQLALLTTVAALSSFTLKFSLAQELGVAGVIWATALGYGAICIPGILAARRALR